MVRSPVGVAFDAGVLSKEHVAVIQGALATVPDWVTPEQLHTLEVDLVERARRLRPASLRKVARRGACQMVCVSRTERNGEGS